MEGAVSKPKVDVNFSMFYDFSLFNRQADILISTLHYCRVSAFLLLLLCSTANAQKIAIITPEKNVEAEVFAEKLDENLSEHFKIIDNSLSETAFNSIAYENPFNLTTADSKDVGVRIGCDYFILVKSDSLRRFSFERKEFYESYAAIFVVGSRSGNLIFWKLLSRESENVEDSNKFLLDSVKNLSTEIAGKIKENNETKTTKIKEIQELPDADSPNAKNFRPPLPYKRIRPEYTQAANLYGIEATIDISVDVDENGEILHTEIVRWAGFGLDEAVAETVRKMNWKPASYKGENLPIRVLLRYNFKKIEDK